MKIRIKEVLHCGPVESVIDVSLHYLGVLLEDGCYKGKKLIAVYLPENLVDLVKVDDGKIESKVVEKKVEKKGKKDA